MNIRGKLIFHHVILLTRGWMDQGRAKDLKYLGTLMLAIDTKKIMPQIL